MSGARAEMPIGRPTLTEQFPSFPSPMIIGVEPYDIYAMNTAFEFLTDVASPSFHPIAGKAKDVAAGAVLISAIGAVVIVLVILGPRLYQLFFRHAG